MQYNDGKYHLEYIEHEYLGGYKCFDWTVVNTLGEPCTVNNITVSFRNKVDAERYIAKLNVCPDGGMITTLD